MFERIKEKWLSVWDLEGWTIDDMRAALAILDGCLAALAVLFLLSVMALALASCGGPEAPLDVCADRWDGCGDRLGHYSETCLDSYARCAQAVTSTTSWD